MDRKLEHDVDVDVDVEGTVDMLVRGEGPRQDRRVAAQQAHVPEATTAPLTLPVLPITVISC